MRGLWAWVFAVAAYARDLANLNLADLNLATTFIPML